MLTMVRKEPEDIQTAMKILWEAGLKNVFIMLEAGLPKNYVFQTDTDAIIAMALLSEEGFA